MAYCEDSDIEQIFGTENVDFWADLSGSDEASTKAARKEWARELATEMVDNILRGTPYAVPAKSPSGSTPKTIVDLTARLAGLWLYEARGTDDMEFREGQPVHRLLMHRLYADKIIQEIRTGMLVLDALKGD